MPGGDAQCSYMNFAKDYIATGIGSLHFSHIAGRATTANRRALNPASSRGKRENGRKNSLMSDGYGWHARDPSTCSHPALPGLERRSGRQGIRVRKRVGISRCARDIENASLEMRISATQRPSTLSPSSTVPTRSARLKRSAGFQTSGSHAHSLPGFLPDRPGLQNHSHYSGLYKDSFRPFCHRGDGPLLSFS